MSEPIFHLVPQAEWARGQDPYAPVTLETEGFVHCSTSDQVAKVADTLFAGRHDLLLLEIDPTKLSAEVVWEDLYDLDEDFPHVYGPIEHSAVVRSSPFVPNDQGRFDAPGR
jgi:uncharacterized protein (DUF952 family)